jgi:hypothetical protein
MVQTPLWQDWQFWHIVVTATAALLGFLGGTVIKYWLERGLERKRERDAARTLATALHAEIAGIRSKCQSILFALGQSSGVPPSAYEVLRTMGVPKPTIYENNANRLGLLPIDLCRDIVEFYSIRAGAEGALDAANSTHRPMILASLNAIADWSPNVLIKLDRFLGRPTQDYGKATAEPVADLPVRNAPPKAQPARPDDAS